MLQKICQIFLSYPITCIKHEPNYSFGGFLGGRESALRLEQWTFCENGTNGNGRSVPYCSRGHGEKSQVALEQNCPPIDQEREGHAPRNGTDFVHQMRPRYRAERNRGPTGRDQEEGEMGQTRSCSSSQKPSFTPTTIALYLCLSLRGIKVW